MRSTQLNFFITPDDIPSINDYFNNLEIIYFNNLKIETQNINLNDLPTNGFGSPKQVFLTKECFTSKIFYKYTRNAIGYMDIESSYALEFTMGGFYNDNTTKLHRARFYSIFQYYNGVFEISKSQEFRVFIKTVFAGFKKKFLIKDDVFSDLSGSVNAKKWVIENNAIMSASGLELFVK
jgi:hypothetical protein